MTYGYENLTFQVKDGAMMPTRTDDDFAEVRLPLSKEKGN
jgi:hypothetical protein